MTDLNRREQFNDEVRTPHAAFATCIGDAAPLSGVSSVVIRKRIQDLMMASERG
ncbi:MAG: hypothetical protein ABTR54_05790 [Candidatus Competibacter sp.]